jgi:hypothetical protein
MKDERNLAYNIDETRPLRESKVVVYDSQGEAIRPAVASADDCGGVLVGLDEEFTLAPWLGDEERTVRGEEFMADENHSFVLGEAGLIRAVRVRAGLVLVCKGRTIIEFADDMDEARETILKLHDGFAERQKQNGNCDVPVPSRS